jgi:hypothetical protein
MTSASVQAQAMVDAVLKIARGIADLEEAVTRLEIAEKQRMDRLRLELWDHSSAPTNGHGHGRNQ